MRTALALAFALAVLACRKEADETPAAPTSFEWSQPSPDGKFEVRQKREASGCRVQAVVRAGEKVLWTSQTCLPAPSGLVFLSPDADKLLVLDLFPSGPSAETPDWSKVTLVSLWTHGTVSRQYTGAELLARDRAADMRGVLSWLQGDTYDQVRAAARAVDGGKQVSADLIDGRTIVLGFEGAALPAPPAISARAAAAEPAAAPAPEPAAAPPPRPAKADADTVPTKAAAAKGADALASDDAGLYRWEDDQGELHFSVGAQIPARYRKRAVPVSASVGVVPMERISDGAPPAGGAAGSAQPGAQPAAGAKPAAGAAPAPAGQDAPKRDTGPK